MRWPFVAMIELTDVRVLIAVGGYVTESFLHPMGLPVSSHSFNSYSPAESIAITASPASLL